MIPTVRATHSPVTVTVKPKKIVTSVKNMNARRKRELALFKAVMDKHEELKNLHDHLRLDNDAIYRFYHHSFKVYRSQATTQLIVAKLKELLPDSPLNPTFNKILAAGSGKMFSQEVNSRWLEETLPLTTAYLHSLHLLECAVLSGEFFINEGMTEPPQILEYPWATLLYLFNAR